jgi:exopolyphosphatase/guanosine-5'-triphosphate,3'-diphosphate pyrophosphatase
MTDSYSARTSIKRAGVIAIGSNSTRLLCADVNAALSNPVRARQETRLFLALSGDAAHRAQALPRLVEAVEALRQTALAAGAETVRLTATAAVRDSGQQARFAEALRQGTGLNLRVLSGEEEARYSFLGAAHPYLGEVGVVDIGGGSTELAIGSADRLNLALSLQLGASRLYAACPMDAPGCLKPAMEQAQSAIGDALSNLVNPPKRWLLVGGTGVALGGLIKRQVIHDAPRTDLPFTLRQAEDALNALIALPPHQRMELPGMTPGREHILPTGLVILTALMNRLNLREMAITQRNNCDGFLYSLVDGLT